MALRHDDIFDMMAHLNISRNAKVTMHTSLRAIGEAENGADGIIDGFKAYLKDGLYIVPTHTWFNVNRSNPFFDVRTTLPCIGTLPTVAAFRADGVRTLHPTHSLAIFGEGADEYAKGEERCQTPSPVFSCLSRLYGEGGKILLVGVGHERNTYLHAVDEAMGIENRIDPNGFDVEVTDRNGKTFIISDFHPHKTEGLPSGTAGVSDFFPNYKRALEYTGAVCYTHLGNATVYCCDARKTSDTVSRLWEYANGEDLCICKKEIPEALIRKIFN